MASISCIMGRRFKGTSHTFHRQTNKPFSAPTWFVPTTSAGGQRLAKVGTFGLTMGTAQLYLGSAQDFFDEKFVTYKNSEDLADLYGSEDLMEIFCVLPFMVNFMMRGAEFDEEGTMHAWGLLGPGELEISINFEEEEIDTTGDGQPDTLAWFNKKEHIWAGSSCGK